MKSYFALFLLMLALTAFAGTDYLRLAKSDTPGADHKNAHGEISYPHIPHPRINPRQVIDVFLTAVDRGELTVFEKQIIRSMLEPVRVEYIYTLDNHMPTVRVFSALKKPLPFPDIPEVFVVGITGVLDRNGHITDTAVHAQ